MMPGAPHRPSPVAGEAAQSRNAVFAPIFHGMKIRLFEQAGGDVGIGGARVGSLSAAWGRA